MYSERTGYYPLLWKSTEELRKEHECLEKEHMNFRENTRRKACEIAFAGVYSRQSRNLGSKEMPSLP